MACFDRLCTSLRNARLRRLATIRVASIIIPCATIFVFAIYAFIPVWYTLAVSPIGPMCNVFNALHSRIYSIILVVYLGFLPPLLMIIFCSITLILLRAQRRRIMPINQARLRRRDNQLIKMIGFYVVAHLICTIPFSSMLLLVVYQLSSPSATSILLFRLSILLFNANFATSFYIYTLGTPFYRHELCSLIGSVYQKIRQIIPFNRIQPIFQVGVDRNHRFNIAPVYT